VFFINFAMLETYPGRLYHDGMTVCCKTPVLKIGSSLKISSNSLNELPLVLIENCGYNGKTTKRVMRSLLIFSIASSVNGFQYRMPTYVFTFVKPFDINDFFNASDCSSVIRLNGDPPPMDSYASLLFGALDLLTSVATNVCKNCKPSVFRVVVRGRRGEKRVVCQLNNHESSSSDDCARTNTNTNTNTIRAYTKREKNATTKIKSKEHIIFVTTKKNNNNNKNQILFLNKRRTRQANDIWIGEEVEQERFDVVERFRSP
jgi:hypothetical protein